MRQSQSAPDGHAARSSRDGKLPPTQRQQRIDTTMMRLCSSCSSSGRPQYPQRLIRRPCHRKMSSSLKKPIPLASFLSFLALVLVGINFISSASAFSATPNDSNNIKTNRPSFKSKSTASIEPTSKFSQGSQARKERLDACLMELGVNIEELTTRDEYRGSAALRTYTSFVLPKSEGALAIAESATRASVVANNIAFLLQEHQAHQTEWLRNHDASLSEIDEENTPRQPLYIILDNVRSAANVGNIIRACEAARITEICFCGSMTPAPPNKQVLKTAVGAAEYVPYTRHSSTLHLVQELKNKGVTVIGVETTSKSVEMWKTQMPQPLALVFGNELVGIHPDVLQECDSLVCIPTHGVKNSLNVATCASIVMWEALRQWNEHAGGKKQ